MFFPLIARTVETIGWGNLWEMHRAYCVGGKPGMDRVAFMQQYTPMYEREKVLQSSERRPCKLDPLRGLRVFFPPLFEPLLVLLFLRRGLPFPIFSTPRGNTTAATYTDSCRRS